ncbi:hypothetical protein YASMINEVIRUS_1177 [Yasminevirus sp. GU-2018]|uniref:Phosphoribosyltransferase domain-containing protein n=1 Tax=Yasminevirus sp. GU-2018 TaxID=2420051 RepID=A0A5K0UBV4_9VIRU|nr:hypothetical protein YASMINEVIRUS_1177 [Yasminevirus sp. GU-2018]
MKTVSLFAFLYRLAILRSINDTLTYFKDEDYSINCYLFKVHVVSNRKTQRSLINLNPKLMSLNNNFNSAHGLRYTIDNLDTTDPLWSVVHLSVKDAVSCVLRSHVSLTHSKNTNSIATDKDDGTVNDMKTTFNKHLIRNLGTEVKYSQFVDDFSIEWFGNMMIGDYKKFISLRSKILSILHYTFYGNYFRKVPYVGQLISSIRRRFVSSSIQSVRDEIREMISTHNFADTNNHTFMAQMFRSVKERMDQEKTSDTYNRTDRIDPEDVFIDNAFISFLVYDFVNIVLKGILFKRVETGNVVRADEIEHIISENFLFPYRGRVLTEGIEIENVGVFRSGDVVLMNLVDSMTLFSYGKRTCPGQTMVRPLLSCYVDLVNKLEFVVTCDECERKIKRASDSDTPFILNNPVGYIRNPSIITTTDLVPTQYRKSGPPLRNIWQIFTNSDLMRDCISVYNKVVATKSDYEYDVIVAPEARALPLAGAISAMDGRFRPVIVLTKSNKFGDSSECSYTRGHSDEKTTIYLYESFKSALKGKRVLFVDDGLASGGTTLACIKLVEQFGGDVKCIFVIVKHSYCSLDDEYTKRFLGITHYCYDI